MKLPKLKLPVLITTRNDGKKEFIGLTPVEWVLSTGALCSMYAVLAGYFTVLLLIAQKIRDDGNILIIPGTADALNTE